MVTKKFVRSNIYCQKTPELFQICPIVQFQEKNFQSQHTFCLVTRIKYFSSWITKNVLKKKTGRNFSVQYCYIPYSSTELLITLFPAGSTPSEKSPREKSCRNKSSLYGIFSRC